MSRHDKRIEEANALLKTERQVGPGTYFSPERIERVLGLGQDHRHYSLRVQALRWILSELIEARTGRFPILRQEDGGLRVLSISEAAQHVPSQVEAKLRAAETWHLRGAVAVDPYIDELSDTERRTYAEKRRYQSRILLHAKEAELKAGEED